MNGGLRALAMVSLILGAGCGSSTSQVADDSAAAASQETMGATTAPKSGSTLNKSSDVVVFPSGSPDRVSVVEFGSANQLFVGTATGYLTSLRVLSRSGKSFAPAAKIKAPIAAIAPDGSLAVLDTSPVKVVNMDGLLILNANNVNKIAGAAFAKGEFSLYIAAPDGTVRIWGQAQNFEAPEPKEKMADYLNRQGSDFNIKLGPLRGPIHSTSNGLLVLTDADGIVRLWNPKKASNAKRVMKLDSAVKSVSTSDADIVTTSRNGSLKVGHFDPPEYLPWSRGEKADYAAASDFLPGKFLQLSATSLRARSIDTGEDLWARKLPAGEPCGLAVSTDGTMAAACVGGFVAVFYTNDGKFDSTVWFDAGSTKWSDASGTAIPLE